ncbi:hypothetical protein GWI33_001299, partial [Rhynchophorus ferrugineus]
DAAPYSSPRERSSIALPSPIGMLLVFYSLDEERDCFSLPHCRASAKFSSRGLAPPNIAAFRDDSARLLIGAFTVRGNSFNLGLSEVSAKENHIHHAL